MISNNVWPKRLIALDVSRGFAALAVVLWHWQHFAYNGTSLPIDFVRAQQPFYSMFKILYEKGSMGVQYFFLLSGFIFFWLYRHTIEDGSVNFTTFWVQRISRLYPLHILTLLIVALLQAMYTSHNGVPFVYPFNNAYHFFLNLVFASKWGFEKGWSFNAPVWSVSIEILLYFMFFITAYARQGQILFCLSVSVISTVIKQFPVSPTTYDILQGATLFFLGGAVFHIAFATSMGLRKIKTAIYTATLFFWALTIINFYIFNLSNFILKLFLGGDFLLTEFPIWLLFPFTVCSLALFEVEKRAGFLNGVSWVGDITYSSYLLHFPLQLLFGLAVSYNILNSKFFLSPIYLIVFFSVLIPLSYVTYIGFERPIQNTIRNRYMQHINA